MYVGTVYASALIFLFDLILYIQSTIFQLYRYESSWVEPVLLHFSLTVKAATLILISGCGSAISSAKEGKSGFIYNLVKS